MVMITATKNIYFFTEKTNGNVKYKKESHGKTYNK